MAVHPVTLQRRVTDAGEPTNREILDELRAFVEEHRDDHEVLQRRLAEHDTASALRDAQIRSLTRLSEELALLHDFRIQVETIGSMTRWILGGSLLAALAAIASLVAAFGHIVQASS